MRNRWGRLPSCVWALLSALCVLLAGCDSSKLPTRVPVQGRVTYQGQPLPAGIVGFTPIDAGLESPNRPAIAEIGRDGFYRVSSFRPGDGLVPGEYRVTVESYVSRPRGIEDRNAPTVSRIPLRYADVAKSALRFTVPADAHQPLTNAIDLKQ